MTKYFKVSCDTELSTFSMGWDTGRYLELGWELATTHLMSKRLKNLGQITDDDVVVVSKDRAFLYENVFKTINYQDFVRLQERPAFVDLTANLNEHLADAAKKGVYANSSYLYQEDIPLIKNINYGLMPTVPHGEPYFVVHARLRNWCPDRNLSIDFWKDSLAQLLGKFQMKCYLFGERTEDLCDNDKVIGVNLREYASLLNRSDCAFVVGSMSGGTMMTQLCCYEGCPVFVIETARHIPGHPLFYDECINFAKVKVTFIKRSADLVPGVIAKVL